MYKVHVRIEIKLLIIVKKSFEFLIEEAVFSARKN